METLDHIRRTIKENQAKSAMAADDAILLGASKGQGAEVIEAFIQNGLTHFGENRVQEAADKWPALKERHPGVTLHLIGPLQTNKVGDALSLFDVIQTLDRPKLAEAIAKELKKEELKNWGTEELKKWRTEELKKKNKNIPQFLNSSIPRPAFYIQVNTGEEPQKSGVAPKDAPEFIRYCRELKLNVAGLMCVPPTSDMPAPHFALLRKLAMENGLLELSMGMSGDYETAIRMGSTCVRVGTALFGERA
ncbi:MAG: YggS family pyridoxal phosphate enzyme [Alphaproteobacteria bacterium]|nr:YggS family pyridoxal phosphate enzyme [Alphaproteobacteria bacterium]